MVNSHHWIVPIPGGSYGEHYDVWGVSVAPAFFSTRDVALSLLMIGSVLFLVNVSLVTFLPETSQPRMSDRMLFAGLILPSVLMYGDPGGVFYNIAPIDFTLTVIGSPIYTFFFTGSWAVASHFTFIYTWIMPWLGVLQFGLGMIQILALRFYEGKRLGRLGMSAVIVASLVISLFLGVNGLAGFPIAFSNLGAVVLPLPLLTIGILIRALSNQSLESTDISSDVDRDHQGL